MYILTLFPIVKLRNSPDGLLQYMNGQIKCDIFAVGFYSSLKKIEIIPFARKWIELNIIVLTEIVTLLKKKQTQVLHLISFRS